MIIPPPRPIESCFQSSPVRFTSHPLTPILALVVPVSPRWLAKHNSFVNLTQYETALRLCNHRPQGKMQLLCTYKHTGCGTWTPFLLQSIYAPQPSETACHHSPHLQGDSLTSTPYKRCCQRPPWYTPHRLWWVRVAILWAKLGSDYNSVSGDPPLRHSTSYPTVSIQ